MLKQRVLTALVLIPLVVAAVFYLPPLAFALITGAIILLAAWEWAVLIGLNKNLQRISYLLLSLMFLIGAAILPSPVIILAALIWWLLALFWVMRYPKGADCWARTYALMLMGWAVLIPCWVALIVIRTDALGPEWLMFLLLLIWGADISAYFVGKRLGQNKLLERVSPNKTKEGIYGALVTTLVLGLIGALVLGIEYTQWMQLVLLCLVTVAASVVGDLTESMVKRARGVKDSGAILPGHGGLLDRIDSLTAAAPIFALGIIFMGMKP